MIFLEKIINMLIDRREFDKNRDFKFNLKDELYRNWFFINKDFENDKCLKKTDLIYLTA